MGCDEQGQATVMLDMNVAVKRIIFEPAPESFYWDHRLWLTNLLK
jgi:hypothetical protein